nr:dysbindin domain-containing protein 2 isoform X3 [Dasypus novemcinctus]
MCQERNKESGVGVQRRGPVPLEADMDPNPRAALERQQLRLRERQKFFEDILQPETEFVFPLSHLHLESQRPPIGSISSMEVNVDTLEQVELIDLGDQDGADVFLPCEDPPPTPQMSGMPLYFGDLGTSQPEPDVRGSEVRLQGWGDTSRGWKLVFLPTKQLPVLILREADHEKNWVTDPQSQILQMGNLFSHC